MSTMRMPAPPPIEDLGAWLEAFTQPTVAIELAALALIAVLYHALNHAFMKSLLFLGTGVVSAFAGIYFTLRFGSARGDNATGLELQVIAAVLLGGVSIFGGRGRLLGVVVAVLLLGIWPAPLLELMQASVQHLVEQIVTSKLPL